MEPLKLHEDDEEATDNIFLISPGELMCLSEVFLVSTTTYVFLEK